MTLTGAGVPSLAVETTPIDGPTQLIPLLTRTTPLLWQRRGAGIAGVGEAVRMEFSGPDRMRDAADAWRELCAAANVIDPVGLPGSGLIAFGTFTFSSASTETSVLIVPSTVIGTRDGRSWMTRIGSVDGTGPTATPPTATPPTATPFGDEYRIALLPGAQSRDGYRAAVAEAVRRIHEHGLDKVVLARDVHGHLPAGADLRRVLADLALGYPDCWTFAVDGFLGASPETLVGVDHGAVSARVLAGTIARGADAEADHQQALALASSAKNRGEHDFAVQSLLRELRPHTGGLTVSEMPFTLKLPNLWHLATDVAGRLEDGSTALDLISALHPTAAVAGTPTRAALELIDELEPFDRGRYAGPVGWIDANGDGEWAVALRSARVTVEGDITAWAGCGIVGDSDPDTELAETAMKFRPIVEAFA
ncbi:isochorismate synthase [Microbacteriaceae bacterium VKM Ac-2855]|nr:isochorismate synthase [Microbacteriaceae bacterium VKM Ac-2855]